MRTPGSITIISIPIIGNSFEANRLVFNEEKSQPYVHVHRDVPSVVFIYTCIHMGISAREL